MAAKRKPARKSGSSQRGSTLYGVLAGLLIGLVVAAVVAFYVTNAPMPFVDRATREASQSKKPDPRSVPDPNAGLYGRNGPAGNVPTGPTATPPVPLPGGPAPAKPGRGLDDLDALIATLPPGDASASAPAAPTVPSAPSTPAAKPAAPAPAPQQSSGTYYLQAGAYRGQQDAEALRARILLLGLPVAVQKGESNGAPINRVRVGPFAKLDDMNRARSRLGENKIEATVVRQP